MLSYPGAGDGAAQGWKPAWNRPEENGGQALGGNCRGPLQGVFPQRGAA